MAGFLELLGLCALGEVAADEDEVGLETADLGFDGFDQHFVVCAEMEVGEVEEASHWN
jgi:hypothetical protein